MFGRQWFASLCGGMVYVLLMVSVGTGKVIYVDGGAGLGGDGMSWGTAYRYLQDALHEPPGYGDEIWVAEGTYYPDEDEGGNVVSNDRVESFTLINGIALYGGFPVGGGLWDERDPNNNETILRGDLAENDDADTATVDLLNDPNRNENSYHVVIARNTDPNTIIDGFIVTAGNANGSGLDNNGGGVYGYPSSRATIGKCTIRGNSANYGGGIFNCEGIITNCVIHKNLASSKGGGLYRCDGLITNCEISINTSMSYGAGIRECNGIIKDCTIIENSSGIHYGGISFCNGQIVNCVIVGNYAKENGAGISYCDGEIINCIIAGNTSGWDGGGITYCDGTIINCTIVGNLAGLEGSGLYDCNGTFINCIIWSNSPYPIFGDNSIIRYSNVQGGWTGEGNIDVYPRFVDRSSLNPLDWDLHLDFSSPCLDAGTNAPPDGLPATDIEGTLRPLDGDNDGTALADMGAYEIIPATVPAIGVTESEIRFRKWEDGTVVPLNQTLEIDNRGVGTLNWEIDYNCSWLTVVPSNGSSTGEPDEVLIIVDPSGIPDWGVQRCELTISDLNAVNSPQKVYVNVIGTHFYVDANALGANNGSSWSDAFTELQSAIALAVFGNEIQVAEGTYKPDYDPDNQIYTGNRLVSFYIPDGVKIYGGFPSFGGTWEQRDPNAFETLLSGDLEGNDVAVSDPLDLYDNPSRFDNSKNVIRGMQAEPNSILDGFTISSAAGSGGGICYYIGTISHCKIQGNVFSGIVDCDGIFINCHVTGNYGKWRGGGFDTCNGIIKDCLVEGNVSGEYGYGGGFYDCDGLIQNCIVRENKIYRHGDGAGLAFCDGTILDCLIYDNNITGFYRCDGTVTGCDVYGNRCGFKNCSGDIYDCFLESHTQSAFYQCNGTVSHCTVTNNYSEDYGGAFNECAADISDCIVSGNHANTAGGGFSRCSGTITNCAVSSNTSKYGGGFRDCSGTISNCTISNNTATEWGGGIYDSEGPIEYCIITNNSAGDNGGGLMNCDINITGCTISGNTASLGGGLMNCNSNITDCIITENTATDGGGGFNDCDGLISGCIVSYNKVNFWGGGMLGCDGVVTECEIYSNTAGEGGGGLNSCNANIENCIIRENSTIHYGGGLVLCNGNIVDSMICGNMARLGGGILSMDFLNQTVSHCVFSGNKALENGGGILFYENCGVVLENCTFANNSAAQGNALAFESPYSYNDFSDVKITSCILWNNEDEIWNNNGSLITVSYSNMYEEWDGLGNIYFNPNFVREGYWDPNYTPGDETDDYWVAGDYHLRSEAGRWDPNSGNWVIDEVTSPCIDKGNPGYELGEEPGSIHNVRVNMGAYGGTAEASKTPAGWGLLADLTNDGIVNLEDYSWQAGDWLKMAEEQPGDLDRDGIIDIRDLWLLTGDWLDHTSWYE